MVVDLDGTLTSTDTLVESLVQLVKRSPANLLRLPLWFWRGRAELKAGVASCSGIATALLPYRSRLLEYLQAEKALGRRIILATAAHRSIAEGVSKHLGLFDAVIATDSDLNLKGALKLKAIRDMVGGEFVYAGDSSADLPIWRSSQAAILVGVPRGLSKTVRDNVPVEMEFPREGGGLRAWLRALRVHQWIKNILVFVPLLTAFSVTRSTAFATAIVAFFAISLAASATYIVNDLLDIESDRAHPRKRHRPFASASISILRGIAAAALLLSASLAMAYAISAAFLMMILVYIALSSAYSWVLKEYILIDVIMLSLLYTLRILAGAVAVGVSTSSWLLVFSGLMFLSLALVKRCSELVSLDRIGVPATRGRDYRVTDLVVLWPLGLGAALSSVVVFGLYISAPDIQARYATPVLLWLVAIALVYWLARLWIKTSRGEMHDDPIVYAVKDRGSRMTVFGMVLTVLASHTTWGSMP